LNFESHDFHHILQLFSTHLSQKLQYKPRPFAFSQNNSLKTSEVAFWATTKLPRTQMTSAPRYKHQVMVPNGRFTPTISFIGWKRDARQHGTSTSCKSTQISVHGHIASDAGTRFSASVPSPQNQDDL